MRRKIPQQFFGEKKIQQIQTPKNIVVVLNNLNLFNFFLF